MNDTWDHSTVLLAHTFSGAAVLASLFGWLPPVAAVIGGVWYMIQIWESHTVQKQLDHWSRKRKLKKVARLEAQKNIVLAELDELGVKTASEAAVARVAMAVDTIQPVVDRRDVFDDKQKGEDADLDGDT